jgi:hypothetical protein
MKNNSFKQTFYLGLVILISVTSFLILIGYNVFIAFAPKFKKYKIENYVDKPQFEKEIVYDTIYLDRPIVKINDTPKNITVIKPKKTLITLEKRDTIINVDTIN